MLNTTMPVILLTIATAEGVHIMTRFFREVRVRQDAKSAVRATMDELMLPVFLTSITTIAGFLALEAAVDLELGVTYLGGGEESRLSAIGDAFSHVYLGLKYSF